MSLTLDTAKAVYEKAVEFGAFRAWDDPDSHSDEEYQKAAENLVAAVVQASDRGSFAPAVLEILHVAGIAPTSDATREAYEERFGAAPASSNGHAQDQTAAVDAVISQASSPSAPSEAQDVPPKEQTSPAIVGSESDSRPDDEEPVREAAPVVEEDISDIFPGYDDWKVADIKKAILHSASTGELSPDEWERILAYEQANEERKTILQLVPEFKQISPMVSVDVPEAAPVAAATAFTQPVAAREPDGVTDFYEGRSVSRAQQENLPMPTAVNFSQNPPVMPIQITDIADQVLSQISTQFNSAFAYCEWLRSQEENRERAAEHLEHETHRDAFIAAYAAHESAIPVDKRTVGTALENARRQADRDADGNEQVCKYRNEKVVHGINARELKALSVGYDKCVWRITEELKRRERLATTARAAS